MADATRAACVEGERREMDEGRERGRGREGERERGGGGGGKFLYLLYEGYGVSEHWFEEGKSFFVASPSTSHAQSHGRPTTNVRIETFREKRDNMRTLLLHPVRRDRGGKRRAE